MKYGVHAGLWMARWTDDIVPILRKVADVGYDGVEVSLLGMTDEKATALGGLVRDHGLSLTCSDGLSRAADITSDDPDVRAAGLDHLRWAVRTTATLGGRGLAGVVYAPWGVFDPDRKAERRALSAEMMGQLDADLARHDVRLGIEAINRFETDLVNTALEAVTLARATGSSRIGVLLDTFHLNIEEKDILAAIATVSDRLFHFHVSDNDRGVPGSGHVPWEAVRQGLRAVGYDGWIVAEMFVRAGTPAGADLNIWRDIEPDATGAARTALSFMRGHFG
jgi:D-psicose/D-tagatose/L-ribulose 3-epimerase